MSQGQERQNMFKERSLEKRKGLELEEEYQDEKKIRILAEVGIKLFCLATGNWLTGATWQQASQREFDSTWQQGDFKTVSSFAATSELIQDYFKVFKLRALAQSEDQIDFPK